MVNYLRLGKTEISLFLIWMAITGCSTVESPYPEKLDPVTPEYQCVDMKTSKGDISLKLDKANAPLTVKNFMAYVEDKFYDSTLFHRVIPKFMIQGGGFTTSYKRLATDDPIENEAYNGLKNKKGTIAMARTGHPHSATAQFFINAEDNDDLNYIQDESWGYAVFGHVSEGMGVVETISQVNTGAVNIFSEDAPLSQIIIYQLKSTSCE